MNKYTFFGEIGRILNSGQTQCLALTGNIFDQFYFPGNDSYEPLLDFLLHKWDLPETRDIIKIVYELNGPINLLHDEDKKVIRSAWQVMVTGKSPNEDAIERLAKPYLKEKMGEWDTMFDEMLTGMAGCAAALAITNFF